MPMSSHTLTWLQIHGNSLQYPYQRVPLPPHHTGERAPAGGSQLMFAFELHSNVNRTLFEPECHVPFKVPENCQMERIVWFGIRKFRVLNRTEPNFSITTLGQPWGTHAGVRTPWGSGYRLGHGHLGVYLCPSLVPYLIRLMGGIFFFLYFNYLFQVEYAHHHWICTLWSHFQLS